MLECQFRKFRITGVEEMTQVSGSQQHDAFAGLVRMTNPFELFDRWMADATDSEVNDPNAVALATADADGLPNVRMVLLKDVDDTGFVFYTNLESAKGLELERNPKAALCFHWKSLRRQVRARGAIEPVSAEEADAYFASRPRASRIGAWASQQSRPMEGRFALEKAIAGYGARFHIGAVPRPDHWSGFRLAPLEIEFWHNRPARLHDRIQFARASSVSSWSRQRLYP